MLAKGSSLSGRGVADGRFRRILPVPGRPGEGLLTQPTAAVRAGRGSRHRLRSVRATGSAAYPIDDQTGAVAILNGGRMDDEPHRQPWLSTSAWVLRAFTFLPGS